MKMRNNRFNRNFPEANFWNEHIRKEVRKWKLRARHSESLKNFIPLMTEEKSPWRSAFMSLGLHRRWCQLAATHSRDFAQKWLILGEFQFLWSRRGVKRQIAPIFLQKEIQSKRLHKRHNWGSKPIHIIKRLFTRGKQVYRRGFYQSKNTKMVKIYRFGTRSTKSTLSN